MSLPAGISSLIRFFTLTLNQDLPKITTVLSLSTFWTTLIFVFCQMVIGLQFSRCYIFRPWTLEELKQKVLLIILPWHVKSSFHSSLIFLANFGTSLLLISKTKWNLITSNTFCFLTSKSWHKYWFTVLPVLILNIFKKP